MEMRKIKLCLLTILILFVGILLYSPVANAQNWTALPPYNTLWPLWSPALSPVNDVTGLPTPIVSSLAPSTQLPVSPGLTWNPSLPYPWLLYNTFSGLAYFDPLAGINLWPAPSLLDDAGLSAPLALPPGYADLPPTDASWLVDNVFTANLYYRLFFPAAPFVTPTAPATGAFGSVLASLLTPLDILGPTLGAPSVLAPVLPPIVPPAPTVIAPPPTLVAPTAAVSQILAEQAGTWQGIWSTGLVSGQMTLNLVEDPIFNTLNGYVQLLGNPTLGSLVNVTGQAVNNQVYVSGSGIGLGGMTFTIDVVGTLTALDTMSGTYTLMNSSSLVETGSFEVKLAAPVVPLPAPTAIAPVPTIPIPTVPIATAPIPTVVAPTAAISALAEQAGTWQGSWTNGLESGPMTLNIVQDPILTSVITGYIQLVGNLNVPVLVDIFGEVLNNQIIASGSSNVGTGSPITIDIVATLTSPTAMQGNYTMIKSGSSIIETGAFQASLIDTFIIPVAAPALPVAPAPVPTVVAPAATLPVPTIVTPTAAISALLAEQFGTWTGTWSTASTKSVVYATGPVTLNLVEDPVSPNLVTGYVQFVGNPVLSVVVDVVGEVLNNQVILSGAGLGIGSQTIQIDIVGTLISPTEMTGSYTQINSSSIIGTGAFSATLAPPVIPVVPPAPVPTVVVPAPTLPVLTAPVPTIPVPTVPVPTIPLPTAPIPTIVAPTAAVSQITLFPFLPPPVIAPPPLLLAEQAGTWQGIWSSGAVSGPMNLNLIEDPLLGTLVGYCQLLGNPFLGTLVDNLVGEVLNNQVILSGSGLGAGSTTYQIELVGTLTSTTSMTGTYTLINSSSIKETGSFSVQLLPPVI